MCAIQFRLMSYSFSFPSATCPSMPSFPVSLHACATHLVSGHVDPESSDHRRLFSEARPRVSLYQGSDDFAAICQLVASQTLLHFLRSSGVVNGDVLAADNIGCMACLPCYFDVFQ